MDTHNNSSDTERGIVIKKSHTHEDGKVCFIVRSNRELKNVAVFRTVDPITFKPTIFVAAYMGYTGSWYAWDPDTGEELARFSKDFFKAHIANLNVGTLEIDPECVR